MSLLTALKVIIEFLETNKIPYMVIGGIANSFYGEPRQTFDIDLKIKISGDHNLKILTDKLRDISNIIPQNPFEFLKDLKVLPIIIDETKIDLIIAELKYELDAIKNSVRNKFESVEINVCKPEDLIIQKSVSEREKDWIDIKSLIRNNYNILDKNYIIKHCKELSDWLSNPDLIRKIEIYFNEK